MRESLTGNYIFNNGWMGVFAAKIREGEEAYHWLHQLLRPRQAIYDDKWMKPLGNRIKTSEETGGLRNLRVPKTLEELTERVAALPPRLLEKHGHRVVLIDEDIDGWDKDYSDLIDYEAFDSILSRRQDMTEYILNFIKVGIA